MRKTFKNYLEARRLKPDTIRSIIKTCSDFRVWLKEINSNPKNCNYQTAIDYVEHLRKLKNQPQTINFKLSNLRHYYNYLSTRKNPFHGVKVRGKYLRVYTHLLNTEELLTLYNDLPQNNEIEIRVKVLAGFYIFQGITTNNLFYLKISDIDLEKGKVILEQTPRANKRILGLHPLQMILLYEVLTTKDQAHLLYKSLSSAKRFHWITQHLHKTLLNYRNYKNLRQLRHSVILNWLKTSNLRQVQYNAGHRYISTTERYLGSQYEELRLIIIEHHPLG